jgi:hypothetical protein
MDAMRMLTMSFGGITAQAVGVAAQLGIVDHLAKGPRTAAELAAATGTHAPSLYRLLRALASLDVLVEDAEGRFSSTPLGDTLRSGVPGSVRAPVVMGTVPTMTLAAAEMLHTVQTGEPAFDHVFGAPFFDYLTAHPDAGAVFNGGMAAFSELENPHIAAAYEFPAGARVVDVGGGRGGFIAAVLRAHPGVRGVLYDLPEVVSDAGYLGAAGGAGRCEILGGSFFESVPGAADVYVVKRILHDWADDTCVQILGNIRRAMPKGGRVLAIDAVLAPRGTPDMNKLTDLLMMVVCPGRERTEQEFRDLYAAAGLRLTRVVPTPSSLSIVEGVPA